MQRYHEFFRFCIVGFIAFAADALVLFALTHFGMQDGYARIFSLAAGMNTAYILNSIFTYRNHRGHSLRTWMQFIASNLVGSLINYIVFLTVLHLAPLDDQHALRLLGIVSGTGVALFFNYWANKRFVFTARDTDA